MTTTPSDTIQKSEVHFPVRRKLSQNARQAMAKYDAGIARERMENPRWEKNPRTIASAGEGKREHPLRRNQQEAFPVRTAEEEIYRFIIDALRCPMKVMDQEIGIG
jgi:hypothetical protein